MIANIWALVKAVPMLKSMFDQLVDLHQSEIIQKIDTTTITNNEELTVLYSKISKAQTNEERKALASILNRISNNS